MTGKPNRRQFVQKAATLTASAVGGYLAAGRGRCGTTTADGPQELTASRNGFAGSLFNFAIDDWTLVPYRPYGSGCTPENVLPVLRELRPGFLMIYAKGETGHTSFRSSLGSAHPALAQELPPWLPRYGAAPSKYIEDGQLPAHGDRVSIWLERVQHWSRKKHETAFRNLPIHYPRVTPAPDPQGKNFEWFVRNEKRRQDT
jgi:hypothetical protein